MLASLTASRSRLAAVLLGLAGACSSGKAQVDGGAQAGYTKIDDMENGGIRTEFAPPRLISGPWWTATGCTEYDDISPAASASNYINWSFSEVPTPYETFPGVVSRNAARLRTVVPLSGTWGAEMGFELAELPDSDAGVSLATTPDGGVLDDAQGCPLTFDFKASAVDLSAYSGITFWAMADPSGTQTIWVRLSDKNNDPRGGLCNATDLSGVGGCFNQFATQLTLTNKLTRYTVDFSSLRQDPAWGYRPDPDVPDLSHVFEFSFAVNLPMCVNSATSMCAGGINGGAPSASFDFWIDDLYFVNK